MFQQGELSLATRQVSQQEMEARLWDAADELRNSMAEAQYSSVIFPLMFWKYLSDTWDHNHELFLDAYEGLDDLSDEEADTIEYRDYQSFRIPLINRGKVDETRASWSAILKTVTQPGLNARVRASLHAIEDANPDKFKRLFGRMTWTHEEELDPTVLAGVMQAMNKVPPMHEGSMSHDVLGGAYEYLLKRFSDGSGTRAGQFFTPREVVNLIIEILRPSNFESVYDPTCGSGGMLIASAAQLKAHGGRPHTLHLFGQESVPDTAGVARMNLYMHNLTQFRVEIGDTLRAPKFKNPDGTIGRFDVIVANPPYSLKWTPWPASDPRSIAMGGVASGKSADWAFVQHMIGSMKPGSGRAGVVLPHGVLFRGGSEADIRRKVVEEDLLEAVIGLPTNLFYNTTIATCILIFRAPGTKGDSRKNEVLFIDASERYVKGKNRNNLRPQDVTDIVTAYSTGADPGREGGVQLRLVPKAEIESNDFDLSITQYIRSSHDDEADLELLLRAYQEARKARRHLEQHMMGALAAVGVDFDDE
ncbi:class I SAM-dependent DNA methyltransferase [Streptomyces sp. SID5614]|uniref:type I restriction-modification system subunit M n=1 Tax=Streptomyces sp. SID5614 TaxID=2690306 RepID=UPI001368A157|nr:class I SAM-dependent DNA methyltransferase [Streptomyces sp. SID5614]MZG04207.1 N-6 DNA methylase [Streptomyces sp. SID5614]